MRLLILLCLCVAVCGQQMRFDSSPILFSNVANATTYFPAMMGQQPSLSFNRLGMGAERELEPEWEERRVAWTRPEMQAETLIPTARRINAAEFEYQPHMEQRVLIKPELVEAKKERLGKERFGAADERETEVTLSESEADTDLTGSGSRTSASKYAANMKVDLSRTKAHEHKGSGTGKAGVLFKLESLMHDQHLEEMALKHEMRKESRPKTLKVQSGFTIERGMGEQKERIKVKAVKPKLKAAVISPIVGITGITDHRLKFSMLPVEQQQFRTEIQAPIEFQATPLTRFERRPLGLVGMQPKLEQQFQPLEQQLIQPRQPYKAGFGQQRLKEIETAYTPIKLGFTMPWEQQYEQQQMEPKERQEEEEEEEEEEE